MKRTVEITIETEELLFVSRRGRGVRLWCEACGRVVEMVTPEEACRRTGVGALALYRLADAGSLPYVETPDGLLLICPESLRASGVDY